MLPLTDMEERRRPAVVTGLLIAVNLLVFVYELMLAAQGGRALERWLIDASVVPARFVAGWQSEAAWLDVLTAMFLHGSVAHVLGNLWFLFVFGRTLEARVGSTFFLVLYLLTGVVATLAQVAVDPGSKVPMLGASGAISGVLGAYFLIFPRNWVLTLVPWIVPVIPLPAVIFLVLWFFVQMAQGLGSLMQGGGAAGGIAWWAHAGGFVAGLLLAAAVPRKGSRRRSRRR